MLLLILDSCLDSSKTFSLFIQQINLILLWKSRSQIVFDFFKAKNGLSLEHLDIGKIFSTEQSKCNFNISKETIQLFVSQNC